MRRGTTPTITIDIPYKVSEIDSGRIVFAQGCKVLEKTLTDSGVSLSNYQIELVLTQAETLRFSSGPAGQAYAKLQVKLKLADGKVVESTEDMFPVTKSSTEEVI